MLRFERITIRGFKSIEALEDLALGKLNVLIGANGAGKSNFVEFFRLLRAIRHRRLQDYMQRNAPAEGFFHKGIKQTPRIEADLSFGEDCDYHFRLVPTPNLAVSIEKESGRWNGPLGLNPLSGQVMWGGLESEWWTLGVASPPMQVFRPGRPNVLHGRPNAPQAPPDWQVYHFHDTSTTAGMRRESGVEQTDALAPDAGNLAAFLLHLREQYPEVYQLLRQTVQRVFPPLDDFDPRTREGKNERLVRLTWRQKGSDYVFSPGHFSDGTLRFICLATALLQPNPPATVVFDEPELGLHPEALVIFAGLVRSAAARMQIILATQSPTLLNEFEPDDVITVDYTHGATQFNRLDQVQLRAWLEDYTLGDLWQKGTLRGGVNHA
jgi:predicted ATPase